MLWVLRDGQFFAEGGDAGWMEGDLDIAAGAVVVDALDQKIDSSRAVANRHRFPEVIELTEHCAHITQVPLSCSDSLALFIDLNQS